MKKRDSEQQLANVLRRLKWLGAVLVCSNLFLGVLSAYMLRVEDINYNTLLENSVPLMNEVRTLGKEGGVAFRGVIEAFVANDAAATETAVKLARDAMQRESQLRLKIESMPLLKDQSALTTQLDQAASEFHRSAEVMLGRVKISSSADAEHNAISQLSRATDRYSAAVQRVADFVETQTASISGKYTKAMNNRLALVIGFAGWPLLLVGVVVLVTIAGLIVLLLRFRQADVGDAR